MITVRGLAFLVAGLLTVTACTSRTENTPTAPAAPSETASPTTSPKPWATTSPAEAGFSPRRLATVVDEAETLGASCFVVVRDGRLVAEHYWRGGAATTAKAVFSVTKSVASTLVGIAEGDGLLDLDDPASRYLPQWRGTPSSEVTIRHLLSNDSGRAWSPATDYTGLIRARDRTSYAVGLGQDHPPGTVWAYNNSAIQALDRVLRTATGQDPATFAQERLFGPLGMTHTRLTGDSSGRSTGMSFGMESTCLDLARFGLLFQQQGRWEGRQVVPASFVREAVGRPSQDLNAAYGLLWWLNRLGPVRGPLDPLRPTAPPPVIRVGRLVPGAPADMYAAQGFGGQVVLVDPGSATVVVRIGETVVVDGDVADYSFEDAARVVTFASR